MYTVSGMVTGILVLLEGVWDMTLMALYTDYLLNLQGSFSHGQLPHLLQGFAHFLPANWALLLSPQIAIHPFPHLHHSESPTFYWVDQEDGLSFFPEDGIENPKFFGQPNTFFFLIIDHISLQHHI